MLSSTISHNDKLSKLVYAGKMPLNNISFASKNLDLKRQNLIIPATRNTIDSYTLAGNNNQAEEVGYQINETGNIVYVIDSSRGGQVSETTIGLFNSCKVILSAITVAMDTAGKSFFDYDAWAKLVARTGYFFKMQEFEQLVSIKANSCHVNVQIINQLLPGIQTVRAMNIAKNVLKNINGEWGSSKKDEKTKIAHLLIFCEELCGCPDVTLKLYYAKKDTFEKTTKNPCYESASKDYEFFQKAHTFQFIDPKVILEVSKKIQTLPSEYKDFIGRLTGYLKD